MDGCEKSVSSVEIGHGALRASLRLLTDTAAIRARFVSRFVMPRDAFDAKYDGCGYDYDLTLMWDKMDCEQISEVPFEKALQYLASLEGEVLIMSEDADFPGHHGITIGGVEHSGFVVAVDPRSLAGLIEYEWITQIRLFPLGRYIEEILPGDLYVFDREMAHMLVFTHENEDWEDEQDESRICLAYGFGAERSRR